MSLYRLKIKTSIILLTINVLNKNQDQLKQYIRIKLLENSFNYDINYGCLLQIQNIEILGKKLSQIRPKNIIISICFYVFSYIYTKNSEVGLIQKIDPNGNLYISKGPFLIFIHKLQMPKQFFYNFKENKYINQAGTKFIIEGDIVRYKIGEIKQIKINDKTKTKIKATLRGNLLGKTKYL